MNFTGKMTNLKIAAFILSVSFMPPALAIESPEQSLATDAPPLFKLLSTYSSYRPVFEGYAKTQKFVQPYEFLATVVHELIHVDSVAHRGYWINGTEYLKPYLTDVNLWPSITNKDILPYLASGPITSQYARNTPNNTLANCIDEINAYTHVIGFVSTHEPESAHKQIDALKGHINMVNVYLYELQRQNKQLTPGALEVVNRVIQYGEKALEMADRATK
jgi:hypothetical protein